jgi:hypothetical protein
MPYIIMPYLDNIRVKDLKMRYNSEGVSRLLGVYRFILEHIQNLDKVLTDFKRTSVIIVATKMKLYIARMKMVSFVYNVSSQHLESEKVIKIIL